MQTLRSSFLTLKNFYDFLLGILVFGVGIISAQDASDFRTYVIYGLVLVLSVLVIDFFVYRRKFFMIPDLVLVAFFLTGYLGSMAAISVGLGRLTVALLTGLLFYGYRSYYPYGVSESLNQVMNILAGIFVSIFLFSLNFFFGVSWWLMLILIFVSFSLLFWQAFYRIKLGPDNLTVASLFSGIALTQIAWTTLYLPVNFFTGAIVIFVPYYLIFMISGIYQKQKLTRDKIYFHVGVIATVLALSLISSPWTP